MLGILLADQDAEDEEDAEDKDDGIVDGRSMKEVDEMLLRDTGADRPEGRTNDAAPTSGGRASELGGAPQENSKRGASGTAAETSEEAAQKAAAESATERALEDAGAGVQAQLETTQLEVKLALEPKVGSVEGGAGTDIVVGAGAAASPACTQEEVAMRDAMLQMEGHENSRGAASGAGADEASAQAPTR